MGSELEQCLGDEGPVWSLGVSLFFEGFTVGLPKQPTRKVVSRKDANWNGRVSQSHADGRNARHRLGWTPYEWDPPTNWLSLELCPSTGARVCGCELL